MKIVLDTNVLLVSLPSHSKYYPIYQALVDKRFDLYVTNEILTEYEEIIAQRLGLSRTDLKLEELLNLSNVHKVEPFYNWQLIEADPDARNVGPQQIRRLRRNLRSRLPSNE